MAGHLMCRKCSTWEPMETMVIHNEHFCSIAIKGGIL